MGWRAMTLVALLSSSVAHADDYPIEVVDRPLLMFAGMNELDLYYSRGQQLESVMEPSGNSRLERSDFGERTRWVLGYSHAFCPFELDAYLSNTDLMLGGRIAPTTDLVVAFRVYADIGKYATGEWAYRITQSLRAGYRALHVPRRFVLYVNGGVEVTEFSTRYFDGVFRDGVQTAADVGASGYVQLTRNVSVYAGGTAGALLQSTIDEKDVNVSATAGLQFSLRRWDISAGVGVNDVTDIALLYVGGEVAFRWGL